MLPDLQLTVDFSGPFWTEISPACCVHLHVSFASAVGSTQAATLEEKGEDILGSHQDSENQTVQSSSWLVFMML